jgi:four helix bundle protein
MRQKLEERLIDFAVSIYRLCDELDDTFACNYLSNQIFRSCNAAALNYAEAQSAESRKDFIHKTSIVLKELRETHVNLQIMYVAGIYKTEDLLKQLIDEGNQLVAIFHKTVMTARKNQMKE